MATANVASQAKDSPIAQTTPSTRRTIASRTFGDLAALALGLGVVLVAIKALLLPFPVQSIGEFARWILRLAIICASDAVFLAGLTLTCGLVTLVVGRWPRVCMGWRVLQLGVFYFSGLFAIFCMALFRVTLQPFNVRMMTFVEGPMTMADSISRYLTWQWITAVALVPVLLTLAPLLKKLLPQRIRAHQLGWKSAGLALVLVGAYASISNAYIDRSWVDPRRWERRISTNPHLAFITSCVEEMTKEDGPWVLVFNPGEADDSDLVSRQRPASPSRVFNSPDIKLAAPRPKNVLVIFMESVGAEYMGMYGSQYDTTPNLDALVAEQGVLFENFYVSVPYSCKSLVSFTSAVYPRTDWNLIVMKQPEFPVPSITEVLREEGYRTCYAHSGYWSWRARDRYLRHRAGTLIDAEMLPESRINSWGVSDRAMFQATLDWIDADPQAPFYLLSYTLETHHPYSTPEKPIDFHVDDEDFNGYLNAIRATDEHIAWLVEELKQRELLEDTLILITSDHGEAFGQHNQRQHNFGVYEPTTHLPLVMIHPSLKDQPRRISKVREQIDVSPTLLDLMGVKSPAIWQGRNLFREESQRPGYFFCVGNCVVLGLRDENFKYHYYVDTGEEELFDLSQDPREKKSIAPQHKDRCRTYRRKVAGLAKFQRRFLAENGSP